MGVCIRYAGCGYVRCLSLWVSLFVCARHCDIMLRLQLRVASVLLCVGVGGRDCGERCQCEHLCVVVAIVPHVCSFRSVLLCEWMSVLITSDITVVPLSPHSDPRPLLHALASAYEIRV